MNKIIQEFMHNPIHPLGSECIQVLTRTQDVNSTEIYAKFAKPSIQIAGPKSIQHNVFSVVFRSSFLPESWSRHKFSTKSGHKEEEAFHMFSP